MAISLWAENGFEGWPTVSLLIPTRGRAKRLAEELPKTVALMERPSTKIVIGYDLDEAEQYEEMGFDRYPQVVLSCAEREDTMSEKYNRCHAAVAAGVYITWSDDSAMLTAGWDRIIAQEAQQAFLDGIGVVYFGTAIAPTKTSPGVALTHRFVEKMGQFTMPGYPMTWFSGDVCHHEIATYIGRIKRIGSTVQIGFVSQGKSRGVRDSFFWRKYFDETRPEREAIARRIIMDQDFKANESERQYLLLCFPWLALEFNYEGTPLRDQANADRIDKLCGFDAPADERYLRAKRAAERKLSSLQQAAA